MQQTRGQPPGARGRRRRRRRRGGPAWAVQVVLGMVVLSALRAMRGAHGAYNPRWGPEKHQLARAYGIKEFDLRNMVDLPTPPGCEDPENADFFSRFRTYSEIEVFLTQRLCSLRRELGSKGSSCVVVEVGRSIENRPIYGVELRNPQALEAAAERGRPEKSILVTGTVHAREWTTTTSVLYSALNVDVTDVSVNLIPVVNPDGYEYTWSGKKQIKKMWTREGIKGNMNEARLWRKNRRRNKDGSFGVDLNRNFGSTNRVWGTDKMNKSVNITESDVFQGSGGFSEPETAAIKNFWLKHKETTVAFFDVHCCIGALLEPFSRQGKAPDYVFDTGQVMIDAINTQAPPNGRYAWRPRPQSSSSGSGISSSWGYQEANITFTYVIEIRGKFVSSCAEIKPIGLETLYGLSALIKELSRLEEIKEEYKNGRPAERKPPKIDTDIIERFKNESTDSDDSDAAATGAAGSTALLAADDPSLDEPDPPVQIFDPVRLPEQGSGSDDPSAARFYLSAGLLCIILGYIARVKRAPKKSS